MPAVVDLVERQVAAEARLTAAVQARVATAWRTFDAPYSPRLTAELAEELAAIVRAGMVNIGALTDAYLAGVIGELTGVPVGPVGAAIPDRIRGVDPLEVYERPVAQYRWLISQNMTQPEARDRAAARLSSIADIDMSLGKRWVARETLRRRRIDEYRRVPMGPKPCGLCLAASSRVYYRDNLLPIHGGCHCQVLPVTGTADPGLVLSDEQLQDLYQQAGSTYGPDLKQVRYAVREHGEYGPVLTVAGHRFRGPGDVTLSAA